MKNVVPRTCSRMCTGCHPRSTLCQSHAAREAPYALHQDTTKKKESGVRMYMHSEARPRWSFRGVVIVALAFASASVCVSFTGARPSLLDRQTPQNCEPKPVYDPNSLPLLAQAKASTPQRYQFALDHGAQILANPDGRSFSVLWYPSQTNTGSKPPMIVTLHGHGSWAFDEFFLWQPYATVRGYGILALQWWFGGGESSSDYYTPNALYPIIECLLRTQGIQAGKALIHGFSRGSAVIYALTALDRINEKFFSLTIANAGGASQDYPPNVDIANGKFGLTPFTGIHWVLFCGGRDSNPERDGCPAMHRSRDWVTQLGGTVDLFIEDVNAGHGGFHMTPAHVNEALDVFARLLGK